MLNDSADSNVVHIEAQCISSGSAAILSCRIRRCALSTTARGGVLLSLCVCVCVCGLAARSTAEFLPSSHGQVRLCSVEPSRASKSRGANGTKSTTAESLCSMTDSHSVHDDWLSLCALRLTLNLCTTTDSHSVHDDWLSICARRLTLTLCTTTGSQSVHDD